MTGYLSTNNGQWRVIVQGMPICADKATRKEAEQSAVQLRVCVTGVWDGDAGEFIEGKQTTQSHAP